MKNFIRKYPVLCYFVLVLIIAGGGILAIVGPDGFPGTTEESDSLFVYVLVVFLFSPILTGVFLTIVIDGLQGLKPYFKQIFKVNKVNIGIKWYLIIILIIPVAIFFILMILSIFNPEYLPDILVTDEVFMTILMGVGAGFFGGGLLEEFGWTGFATSRMRKRYDALTTGLVIGFVWGIWHIPITLWASGDSVGNLSLDLFVPPLVFYMLVLPLFRVLMVFVYDYTKSLFLLMLMHAGLTANTIFILKPNVTGSNLVQYYFILGAILLVSIIVIKKIHDSKTGSLINELH